MYKIYKVEGFVTGYVSTTFTYNGEGDIEEQAGTAIIEKMKSVDSFVIDELEIENLEIIDN